MPPGLTKLEQKNWKKAQKKQAEQLKQAAKAASPSPPKKSFFGARQSRRPRTLVRGTPCHSTRSVQGGGLVWRVLDPGPESVNREGCVKGGAVGAHGHPLR